MVALCRFHLLPFIFGGFIVLATDAYLQKYVPLIIGLHDHYGPSRVYIVMPHFTHRKLPFTYRNLYFYMLNFETLEFAFGIFGSRSVFFFRSTSFSLFVVADFVYNVNLEFSLNFMELRGFTK